MHEVKATVVLVTYNQKNFIRQALDSIFAQIVDFDYEIIVRDDASTDGTSELLYDYASRHDNIRLIINESNNFGSLDCFIELRDIYCKLARGEYIFSLDGDDFWADPHKMQRQVSYLDSNPSVSFSFHAWRHVSIDGTDIGMRMPRTSCCDLSVERLRGFQYAWILLGTCCFRRGEITWPVQMASSVNLDMFLPYVYGKSGSAHFHDEIGDLCYRQHSQGIWVGADVRRKQVMKLQTSLIMLMLLSDHSNLDGFNTQLHSRFLPALKNFRGG